MAAEIEQAYREHGWHVYRRALGMLGNPAEAEDVCQEVFLRLCEHYDDLRDARKLTAWLFRVSTHRCIDRLRLRKDHRPEQVELLGRAADADERAALRELALMALEGVSARDQELAVLRFVDGLTMEELEQTSGLTRKTVSRRLERFRTRARKIMAKHRLRGEEGGDAG
ncbi:MAG: sigma-70 family RNA polymerase sigma factor [Deltaproteobacteria bacterium]|nr:sigma-70 family RNA polymerase sigma factor [Deltaproteobacteria bacterium]